MKRTRSRSCVRLSAARSPWTRQVGDWKELVSVADVEKILRLVSDGVLSPAEADEILGAIGAETAQADHAEQPQRPTIEQQPDGARSGTAGRHLRVQVSDGGRQVINLRVPMNIAGWATAFLPGLPDDYADRIRSAMASGERGPILDINSDDGSRVLIVSE